VPHRAAPLVIVRHDPALRARIVARRALRYAAGADPASDRPAHVRAASGVAALGGRLAVIQDDANFVALVDPRNGLAEALVLPAGPGGRRQFGDDLGNKHHKLDLEACILVREDGRDVIVAFGSGSSAERERVVLVSALESSEPSIEVTPVPALYDLLRRTEEFAGSDLNIEGALLRGATLRLFGRGNGVARGPLAPANAACSLDWPLLRAHIADAAHAPLPGPFDIVRYDLGALEGIPLGFTDAAPWRGGALFAAAAEDSPDARRDGPVTGSVVGVLVAHEGAWTPLLDEHGALFRGKIEGLAVHGTEDRVYAVADGDDPGVAAELLTIALGGGWSAR
jgi:hypothetical protein